MRDELTRGWHLERDDGRDWRPCLGAEALYPSADAARNPAIAAVNALGCSVRVANERGAVAYTLTPELPLTPAAASDAAPTSPDKERDSGATAGVYSGENWE